MGTSARHRHDGFKALIWEYSPERASFSQAGIRHDSFLCLVTSQVGIDSWCSTIIGLGIPAVIPSIRESSPRPKTSYVSRYRF